MAAYRPGFSCSPWSAASSPLIIVPFLPGSAPLGDKYRDGFLVLASVAVLGVLWELLYHLLMQWRWEKDWPTLFGLVDGGTGGRC